MDVNPYSERQYRKLGGESPRSFLENLTREGDFHLLVGGGTVVAHPPRLVDSAHACCAACTAHNSAEPRPRGRVNCTTWVWNSDASHAQAREFCSVIGKLVPRADGDDAVRCTGRLAL